jgi:hypothetical protein
MTRCLLISPRSFDDSPKKKRESSKGNMMFRIRNKSFAPIHLGFSIVAASLLFIGSASAAPPQITDVISFATGEDVGDAMLIRTPNGVNVKIWTTGLDGSAVYTVWWVIDADKGPPSFCVSWATGHPIGPNGTGNFSAHLTEGEAWTEEEPGPANGGAGPCPGLVDAENQTIWVVLRSHGPIIPGIVDEQMSTYLGGCVDDPEDPNFCEDQQIAFF